MKKRLLPILLLLTVFSLAAAGGICAADNPLKTTSKSPIQITSDRLEAYDDKALVLFSGNVVATQDDAVIRGDKLYLYYEKKTEGEKAEGEKTEGEKAPSGLTVNAGKIQRIELKGNVNMKKGERTVTGEKAVFLNANQTVVVTGNAVMREGDNVIMGDRVTVFLEENRGVVESSGAEKRVTATFYPKESTPADETPAGETSEDNTSGGETE